MAKAFDPDISLTDQARAYLDINCAHCHKPTGSASNSGLWLEWETKDAVKWGVGKHPTAAGRGSGDALVVIEPGQPERSILSYRMASDEAGIAMPELGRALIDEEGVALINAWISEMETDG
jgi:mono/diheme cytochrome c family protein